MQPPKENTMVEPCDICGNCSFPETIVTCSKCNINCEHAYCMRVIARKIPKDWLCEPCQSKGVSNSLRKVNQDIGLRASKMQRAVKTGKVKFLHEDEVIRLSSGKASVGSKNVISKIPSQTPKSNPPISPPKALGKLPRNEEVHKKPMTNQHASCSLSKGPPKDCIGENQKPLGGVIRDKKVQTHDLQKEKPTKGATFEALSARKSSPIIGSGGILVADAEYNQSNPEKSDLKSIQENLNLHRKFLPSSIPAWRGQFQILQTAASRRIL
ncbi:Remodeling and spacing factor 1 [Spatholobus suberectus]|nr:Remodeling and spacing factor 1 [Spatholobus suberectus]